MYVGELICFASGVIYFGIWKVLFLQTFLKKKQQKTLNVALKLLLLTL
jgi:hypothetical protein